MAAKVTKPTYDPNATYKVIHTKPVRIPHPDPNAPEKYLYLQPGDTTTLKHLDPQQIEFLVAVRQVYMLVPAAKGGS